MLTPNEAMDIPDGLDGSELEQRRIASLGITLGQFCKTLRGRTLIQNDKHFVLNGQTYQGFNERALECTEDMLTLEEIDGAIDIDGSKQRILDTRARRLAGNKTAKDRELGERRKLKIAQERDEIELMLLKRRLAKEDAEIEEQQAEPAPEPESEIHACAACGKVFPTARGLNAHKMGSKH